MMISGYINILEESALYCAKIFHQREEHMITVVGIVCMREKVIQQSTRQAQWCLTSEFRWDLVFTPWYDRMTIYANIPR